MAEPPSKRQRDNHDVDDDHDHPHTKKERPYDDIILSLLEDDEDVPSNQDLSSFITSLQRELDNTPADISTSSSASSLANKEDTNEAVEEDEEDKERLMRRLLEASDDELGLPSRDDDSGEFGWGEGIFCDGLWEIEHFLQPEEEEELLL